MKSIPGVFRLTAVFLAFAVAIFQPRDVAAQNPNLCYTACVTTQGYDNNRDNVNSFETGFTVSNFSLKSAHSITVNNLHGIIFAQPLYLSQVPTDPEADILYVATEENWIYALQANAVNNAPVWSDDFNTINCPSPCTGGGDTVFGPVPDADLSDGAMHYYPRQYSPTFCSMGDFDLDAGGLLLARPVGITLAYGDHFVVMAAGKEGVFYVLQPSQMGTTGPDTLAPCTEQPQTGAQTIQCFAGVLLQNTVQNGAIGPQPDSVGSRCSAAFWAGPSSLPQDYLYLAGSNDTDIWAYQMNINNPLDPPGSFNPVAQGSAVAPKHLADMNKLFPYPGACPEVTWNQNGANTPYKDAILWIMGAVANGTESIMNNTGAQPVVITAYQALPNKLTNALTQLSWTDYQNGPGAVPFAEPTVVNGYVYAAGESISGNVTGGVRGLLCTTVKMCLGAVTEWY